MIRLDARSGSRFLERRLGRTGVVAAGLLVACAAFWSAGVQRAEREVASLREDVAAAQRKPGRDQVTARAPQEALAAFESYFAGRDELHLALHAVFAAAREEGLELDTGEYRMIREAGSSLVRYQVTFPLKGEYTKIRRFVARAMNEVPGVALDDLSLRRENVQATALEAQVQLSIFLGAGA